MSEEKSKDKLSLVVYEKNGKEYPVGIKESVFNGYEESADSLTSNAAYLEYFIPAITTSAYNNLYGRLMTLIEATTDKDKLKVVKQLFQRELNDYFSQLEKSVEELDKDHIAGRGYYYKNVYVYGRSEGRVVGEGSPELEI